MLSAGWMDPDFCFVRFEIKPAGAGAGASSGRVPGYSCNHTSLSGLTLPRSCCKRAPNFKYLGQTLLDATLQQREVFNCC